MDIGEPSLDSYASYLRTLISSISNLREFASFIVPDDDGAAGALLCSLQNLQLRLESWANSHPVASLQLDQTPWTPDILQSVFPTDDLDSVIYSATQPWCSNPITSVTTAPAPASSSSPSLSSSSTTTTTTTTVAAAAASSIFDVIASNSDAFGIPITADKLRQLPDALSLAHELPLCMPNPLGVHGTELDEGAATLCGQEESYQHSPSGTRSSTSNSSSASTQSPNSTLLLTRQASQQPLHDNRFTIQSIDASGGGLLLYLKNTSTRDDFQNVVHIDNLPKLSWDSVSIADKDLTEYHYRGVTYQLEHVEEIGRLTRLFVADETCEFQLAPDDVADERPADGTGMQFLESLALEASREGSVSYLVGPPLDERWSNFVDAGERLRSQMPGDIKGITSPYWYLGGKFAGTAFHKEDCDLRSMNLVIYGYKLWLLIDTQDTERFEEWVRSVWGKEAGYDDQWLRHLNLVLPPSMLTAAHIRFNLICAGPGDLITTSPGQYHYVINMTTSLAIAVNFLLPGELIAMKQTFLCKDCGIYPLVGHVPNLLSISESNARSFCKRSFARPNLASPRKRLQRTETGKPNGYEAEISEEARCTNVIKKLQAPPASCLAPVFLEASRPNSKIIHLAMAMRGRSAVAQVWKLQQASRHRRFADISEALIDRSLRGNTQQAALDKGIIICTGANQQSNLLRRLLTWHFAEEVELSKGPTAIRASSTIVSQYAGESPRSRYSKLKYRGDLLHMICGSHRGLLPFIPLQRDNDCNIRDPESQYQYSATKREFKGFEKIFQADDMLTRVFCTIGTNFLDSWGYKDQCEFRYDDWLGRLHQDFSELLVESLSNSLGQGVCGCSKNSTRENFYERVL